MSMGSNVKLNDKLIRRTADKESNKSNVNKKNITSNVDTTADKEIKRLHGGRVATRGTKKATFYIKNELLQKLYNFAYWERLNVTDAFNTILTDGLKGKNTKEMGK